MKSLILMLQFFTRIPINIEINIEEDSFGKGIIFFPIVGLVIGSIDALAYLGFSRLFSGILPIILVVLVNVLVTGALHLDGLADSCDGIFSSRSRDRMLEIMKDSRIGTNGVIAIFFDLVLRIALLQSFNGMELLMLIFITPIISKTMLSILIYISRNYSKGEGLGNLFIGKTAMRNVAISFLYGVIIIALIMRINALIIILIEVAFIVAFQKYILSKIGTITGDILGAANELSEILALACYLVITTLH